MKKYYLLALGIILIVGTVIYIGTNSAKSIQDKKLELLKITDDLSVEVVASTTCGCCKLYAQYLEQEGFDVDLQLKSSIEVEQYKNVNAIPENLRSCHTTRIGKIFIEGHIPIEAIKKVLIEKPDLRGIALPDMPSASPGMPGPKYAPFEIRTITNDGKDGGIYMSI
jgi:hypothetical protein